VGFLSNRSAYVPNGVVSVANQQLTEGDSGTSNMTFTVQLSGAQAANLTFDYRTENGTGTAGVDYTAVSGRKTITAGQTSTTIDVPIIGDTSAESSETFTLRLSRIRFV
jgi:fibronectin-binding autotransporter adhesin